MKPIEVHGAIRSQVRALRAANKQPYAVVLGSVPHEAVSGEIQGRTLSIIDPDNSDERHTTLLPLRVERSDSEDEIRVRALAEL